MSTLASLLSGLVGAGTVTLLNESVRQFSDDAPRMDRVGIRALAGALVAAGAGRPRDEELYAPAMAGDLATNTLYYALVGLGPEDCTVERGALLGLAAGVGALTLPGPLGLGAGASNRTPATQAMTLAWYLAGGLAASLAMRSLTRSADR